MYLKPHRSALHGRSTRCRAFVFHYREEKIPVLCSILRPPLPASYRKKLASYLLTGKLSFPALSIMSGATRELFRCYRRILLGRITSDHTKRAFTISTRMAVLGAEYTVGASATGRCHYRPQFLFFLSARYDL